MRRRQPVADALLGTAKCLSFRTAASTADEVDQWKCGWDVAGCVDFGGLAVNPSEVRAEALTAMLATPGSSKPALLAPLAGRQGIELPATLRHRP